MLNIYSYANGNLDTFSSEISIQYLYSLNIFVFLLLDTNILIKCIDT